jgi:hypothetical protein
VTTLLPPCAARRADWSPTGLRKARPDDRLRRNPPSCRPRRRITIRPTDLRTSLADDGGKKARSPGESTKETVKTIAQGMPADLAKPVVTAACVFCCRRAMGEAITRHFPAPSSFPEGQVTCITRARTRRGIAPMCLPQSGPRRRGRAAKPDAAGLAAIRTGRLGLLWGLAIVTILAERYGVGDV